MPDRVPVTLGTGLACALLCCTGIGILLVPFVLNATLTRRAAALAGRWDAEVRRRFVAFVGATPDFVDTGVFRYDDGFRGTGIACRDGNVFLMQDGHAIEVPLNDVRDWSYAIHEPVLLASSRADIRTSTLLLHHNLASAYDAARRSGVTVRIDSVESPAWLFTTSDAATCERWMLILDRMQAGKALLAA
jgi:hypothetical protein